MISWRKLCGLGSLVNILKNLLSVILQLCRNICLQDWIHCRKMLCIFFFFFFKHTSDFLNLLLFLVLKKCAMYVPAICLGKSHSRQFHWGSFSTAVDKAVLPTAAVGGKTCQGPAASGSVEISALRTCRGAWGSEEANSDTRSFFLSGGVSLLPAG